MTPEEAINQLEFDRAMMLFDPMTGEEITLEALKAINKYNYLTYIADGVAITALKEIQLYKDGKLCLVPKDVYSKQCCELDAYKEIGTVEECREAVEKQKAKKPDIYTDTRNMVDLHGNVYAEQANVYLCPTFEIFIGYVGNNIFHYCPVCGQAIDDNLEGMEDV